VRASEVSVKKPDKKETPPFSVTVHNVRAGAFTLFQSGGGKATTTC
jgi:hypothetical protein